MLSAFLAHWVGVYAYFFIKLKSIREEMRAQLRTLPDHELTRLELSLADYQAAKVDEHEVKIDGKMYDISRFEKKGNQVVLYALQDEAEDNLFSLLDEITKRTSDDKARASATMIQFTALLFLIPNSASHSLAVADTVYAKTGYQFSISSLHRAIESPPPRRADHL